MLECTQCDTLLLTHPLVPAGPVPTAYDPEGVYPYESYCETSRRPVLKKCRFISLENDYVRVTICPDLGGRVYSLLLKDSGKETLFVPRVVRPIRILPRHFFAGGGIEVSFPISHTPVQIVPVLFSVERDANRLYVCCGERELRFGMHWTVEYSLGERENFLTQRTVFRNPDSQPHLWMSWSNAGVPACRDTEFHFPDGPVLFHGREMKTIDWKTDGPRRQSDVNRMCGFFWKAPDCCAFGAFTPSLGCGLYHVADPSLTPGIKLWSDGVGPDQSWVRQYTLDGRQCLEIQAGPLIDQSVKDALGPGKHRFHEEFWIPSTSALDIRKIALPQPPLRSLVAVPSFNWARPAEVEVWQAVLSAHAHGRSGELPDAPGPEDNNWAVSGMPELGEALRWAVSVAEGVERERWLFQLGAWLAGREEPGVALEVLTKSRDDRARALAGRLWLRHNRNARAAAESFRAIESCAVALHPQVVIERDRALAALGKETLSERTEWLAQVAALEDEWLAERQACLLLDRGDALGARELLQRTRFQLVHQRYARTRLWRRVQRALNMEAVEHPAWLGEDELAEFGAYREYGEDHAID